MPRKQRSRKEKQLEHEQVLPLLRSIGRPGSGKRRLKCTLCLHITFYHFFMPLCCCWLWFDEAFWLFISTSLSHLSSGWTSATRDRQKTQKILEVLQKPRAGLWQDFCQQWSWAAMSHAIGHGVVIICHYGRTQQEHVCCSFRCSNLIWQGTGLLVHTVTHENPYCLLCSYHVMIRMCDHSMHASCKAANRWKMK